MDVWHRIVACHRRCLVVNTDAGDYNCGCNKLHFQLSF